MSNELAIYKQNRISELNRNYNANLARLKSDLTANIRRVQLSRNSNKQQLINALIAKYNNDVSILKSNLNAAIKSINNFKPQFNVTKVNNKKALLVGINYIGTEYELSGCVDDANRMKNFLANHGFTSFKMLTDYTDVKPTKENILNELRKMIVSAADGDILFFHYSGHGSNSKDRNNDETDGMDEMIISSDLQGILDDELKNLILLNMKRDNVTIVGIFDSCFSGTILDLRYNYLDSNNYDKYTENNKESECVGNVIMISGCMESQTSAEAVIDNKPQGAMTWSFIETMNKTPNCSWRELLKSMRDLLKSNSFDQIPQLSTDSFYDIDSKVFI